MSAAVITTRRDSDGDLVDRNFVDRPNQLWVAYITNVPRAAGFLYLAVVLDVFSRRIVGRAMETHLRTELILGHWRWRSVSASRAMSSTTATRAPNIRLRQRHVRELLATLECELRRNSGA